MPLRFLHLSATDRGGAGAAAARLHDGLRSAGHTSRMIVLDRTTQDADVVAVGDRKLRARRIINKVALKLLSDPDFYFQNQSLGLTPLSALFDVALEFRPDVIVSHFVSHYLSMRDAQSLYEATGAPVIWHLLDMASLTGGCHYAWKCTRYQEGCHTCPALRLRARNDLSARIWNEKSEVVPRIPSAVVAGSSQLARQAQASALFGEHRIDTVLLGVSSTQFGPERRPSSRKAFGIPNGGKVIFFGAQRFDQRRKGMPLLIEALALLRSRSTSSPLPFLLIAGDTGDLGELDRLGYPQLKLGSVDTSTLANAYAAADLFACPSIEDSGPMMVNEALMSGTPVVAFRVGVVPDLVIPGLTGEIVEVSDAASFARGLSTVLAWSPSQQASAASHCRATAVAKCAPEVQVRRFVDIAGSLRNRHV